MLRYFVTLKREETLYISQDDSTCCLACTEGKESKDIVKVTAMPGKTI